MENSDCHPYLTDLTLPQELTKLVISLVRRFVLRAPALAYSYLENARAFKTAHRSAYEFSANVVFKDEIHFKTR